MFSCFHALDSWKSFDWAADADVLLFNIFPIKKEKKKNKDKKSISDYRDRTDNRFFQLDFILHFCTGTAGRKRQESQRQTELVREAKLSYPQSVASRTVRVLWKAVARLPNDSVKLPKILEKEGRKQTSGNGLSRRTRTRRTIQFSC